MSTDTNKGFRYHPDEDLEEKHNEKFGIRPQDLGIPLSEQGLQPDELPVSTPEQAQTPPAGENKG